MNKTRILFLSAALSAGLLIPAGAESVPGTLSVSGKGEVTAAADTASFEASIETTAATQEAAASQNAARSRALRTALTAAGAQFDRLSTENYTVNPIYHYDSKGRRTLEGYTAVNRLSVRVPRASRAGSVLDAAVRGGADRIDAIRFFSGSTSSARREAYLNAGKDARQKAAAAAEALGKSLGRALSISESDAPSYRRPVYLAASLKSAAYADTPVQAEDETIRTELQVTYELL